MSFCCSSTLNTVLTHWCKIPHSSFTGGFWSETSSTHADGKKTLSLQKANIQMALNKLDFTMQCLDLTKMINKCWKDDPETWKVKVLQFTYCEYSRVPLGPWDVNLFFVWASAVCHPVKRHNNAPCILKWTLINSTTYPWCLQLSAFSAVHNPCISEIVMMV